MNKHLLLTGGAGFIGHHTVEGVLKNTDWNITILDRLTYAGDLNRLVDLDCWEKEFRRVRFLYHDFRAPINLGLAHSIESKDIFGPVDYIIHMGAESHVDRSIADPMPFVESNVVGTVNMLNFARQIEPQKMIYVSTDETVGPMIDGHLHGEGDPHKPGNPYSASKAAAEDFCMAFYNTYGTPVLITRTMNNFGERQDIEKFVPKTMRSILTKQPVIIHVKKDKEGNVVDISSRCWLHARNHADALLFLLKRGTPGERYNVAGELKNVAEMANMIGGFMGYDTISIDYQDFHSFRPGHDMAYGLNGDKMKLLGWTPPFGLNESLQKTIEWTINHKKWLNL